MYKNIMLLFFLTVEVVAFGQDVQDKYLITYIEKRIASEDLIKKVETYPKFLRDKLLKEINVGEEKILFLDKETSFYSLKENIKNIKIDGDRTQVLALSDYYKDLKKKLLIIDKYAGERKYIIKGVFHPFKWRLIDKVKKINDLTCKKATSTDSKGRKIIAWYVEDIKISNGPDEYGGLPGLIVELESKFKSFKLKEIEKTNTKQKIDFPSLKNAITMEDFKKEYNPKNSIKKTIRYN